MRDVSSGLDIGFLLDRQWHWLKGDMEQSKRPALLALARVLAQAGTPYAIIGGLAVQIHQKEPRTTLDIDLVVLDRNAIPREALRAFGFRLTGTFAHSENWISVDGTPVQFTDDPALSHVVSRAALVVVDDVTLHFISIADLLHEKLRAGSDPERRRSKRLRDLADAQTLLEENPELASELSAAERTILDELPR
jgi:hypothetical protein